MNGHKSSIRNALLMGAAVFTGTAACPASFSPAYAQEAPRTYNIPAQALNSALRDFAIQTGRDVLYPPELVAGKQSPGAQGLLTEQQALEAILSTSGLRFAQTSTNGYVLQDARASAAGANSTNGDEGEEIVVTGTNIRGILNSASPSIRLDRDAIDRSGYATTQALVESIPQNFGAGASDDTLYSLRNDSGNNIGGGSGVNLRGLGTDSTLVLLNGRRLAAAGTGNFVDVSLIPLSAIDRIDVLTDGASAIYGSDAVGGVMNVILRRNFEGAETSLGYASADGDLDEWRASQTLGSAWNSGNLLGSYEHYERDRLSSSDRDYTASVASPTDLLARQERDSLLLAASQKLGSSISLDATAFLARRTQDNYANFFGNVTHDNAEVEQASGSLGLQFDVGGGWLGELASGYSSSNTERTRVNITSGLPSPDFNDSSRLSTTDLKFDGPIHSLLGGEARLAVGVQYRHEWFREAGGFISTGVPEFTLDRDTVAAYGELFLPFIGDRNALPGIRRLELSVAARYEDFSDFGSATNPKLGVLWEPMAGLSFRGTYGTSFRAPLLFELGSFNEQVFLIDLPNPSAPSGTSLSLVTFGNNPALQPERSETWTAGFDWNSADRGTRLSATYFNTHYEDRIAGTVAFFDAFTNPIYAPLISTGLSSSQVSALIASPAYVPLSASDPFSAEALVDNRLRNTAETNVSGLDFQASKTWQSSMGEWTASASATYLFEFENRLLPAAPTVDNVDTLGFPVDLRIRAGLNWTLGNWSATTAVNYTDGYDNATTVPTNSIDSWTTVDLQLQYAIPSNASLLSGIRIAAGATNIFDVDPPFVADPVFGVNFDGENASPLGRLISLRVTKSW